MKTILVIDDDKFVLHALSRALRSTFVVTRSEGVRDAIGLIASGHRFDVILCDMLLADGTGRDFYDQLLGRSVDQADRVLFLSGDPDLDLGADFGAATLGRRMSKPCSTSDILDRALPIATRERRSIAA